MTETLRINGIEPTDEAVDGLAHALAAGYEAARDELATTGRALPGAQETLALLADDASIYQSVLTGNLKQVARIKLEVFDFAEHLDLAAGAYGKTTTIGRGSYTWHRNGRPPELAPLSRTSGRC